jgi:hypothetical protein
MGGIIYAAWRYISVFAYRGLAWMIILVLAMIVAGAGIYLGFTILLRMDEVRFVMNMLGSLKNRFGKKGRDDDR